MDLHCAAERLHRATKDLIIRYQFRDRNQICCHGLSVSQCYVLDALAQEGDLTMQRLAGRMHLAVSTMTRVVAQLVRQGYARRRPDPEDGRVVHVAITPRGKEVMATINRSLLDTQKAILKALPPGQWEGAIAVVEALGQGVREWQAGCCAPPLRVGMPKR
jgi:MarR family transcriptional regulator, 2-MHQ and catechol-resistance regulon repressor